MKNKQNSSMRKVAVWGKNTTKWLWAKNKQNSWNGKINKISEIVYKQNGWKWKINNMAESENEQNGWKWKMNKKAECGKKVTSSGKIQQNGWKWKINKMFVFLCVSFSALIYRKNNFIIEYLHLKMLFAKKSINNKFW